MKSTKKMLLGVVIALIGVGFAQPGNSSFVFREFLFIPVNVVTFYFPLTSIILIFIGAIIGIIGYIQKDKALEG